MITTLLASHNEELYKVELCGVPDIADLVRDNRVQVLSSTDGSLDFWFSDNPRTRVNRHGTALLLATTRFTAYDVPLLRGSIVIAAHDSAGRPASLTDRDMSRLVRSQPSWREERIVLRRCNRDRRAQQRSRGAAALAARKSLLHRAIGRTDNRSR